MTVKISISLTDQQAEYVRRQVAEGRFPSTSAVIQQAVEAKRREDEAYEREREAFFEMLSQRAKEPPVDMTTFRTMVDDLLAEKRCKYGMEN